MSARKGQCINFGLCSTADGRKRLTVMVGGELVCPECGQPLQPSRTALGRFRWKPVSFAMGLALVGLAVHWMGPNPIGNSTIHASANQGSVVLRLSGANRIGSALAPSLAEEFLKQQGAREVRTVPLNKPDEVRVEGILPGDSSPKVIEIRSHGSNTAFEDLKTGSADIGMASRAIKPKEVDQLAKAGLGSMSSPGSEHVLGLDAIAVIVSPSNPVESLTSKQVALIFGGELRNWSDIGRSSGPVNIYTRDDSSGVYETFKSLVLRDRPLANSARRITSNAALADDVSKDPNGIGVIALENVGQAKTVAISENGTRPLLPNQLNVATEDYPFTRRLTLYTPANPRNELTRKFVEFALSSKGQQIVAKNGFVGQNVASTKVETPTGAPQEYRQLTSAANRLSIDFRFKPGSTDLDNKSLADLDRVVTFIADLHYTGDRILLFGFADNTGSKQVNDALSKDRADAVGREFDRRGIQPASVVGFGSELSVATNDSPEGRQKNRRVEIWLTR